jgi:hypothetical protein
MQELECRQPYKLTPAFPFADHALLLPAFHLSPAFAIELLERVSLSLFVEDQ